MNSEAVRLDWSRWSRCESSFNLLLTPHQPGIFALAEEVADAAVAGGDTGVPDAPGFGAVGRRRMLAVLEVGATEDLARALSWLFAPGSPQRERIASGNCFVRYAVVPDADERQAIVAQLQQWLTASAEAASGIAQSFPAPGSAAAGRQSNNAAPRTIAPAPLPSGF